MKYSELIDEFMKAFPEFEAGAKEELDFWEGEEPAVHVFFANVLSPPLEKELIKIDKNHALLRRIFSFLEEMATSEDEQVQEVAAVTILEHLGDDKERLRSARLLMGNHTRKMSEKVEKGLGRE